MSVFNQDVKNTDFIIEECYDEAHNAFFDGFIRKNDHGDLSNIPENFVNLGWLFSQIISQVIADLSNDKYPNAYEYDYRLPGWDKYIYYRSVYAQQIKQITIDHKEDMYEIFIKYIEGYPSVIYRGVKYIGVYNYFTEFNIIMKDNTEKFKDYIKTFLS